MGGGCGRRDGRECRGIQSNLERLAPPRRSAAPGATGRDRLCRGGASRQRGRRRRDRRGPHPGHAEDDRRIDGSEPLALDRLVRQVAEQEHILSSNTDIVYIKWGC